MKYLIALLLLLPCLAFADTRVGINFPAFRGNGGTGIQIEHTFTDRDFYVAYDYQKSPRNTDESALNHISFGRVWTPRNFYLSFGVALSEVNELSSTNVAFRTGLGIQINTKLTAKWTHISNAGTGDINRGNDFLTVSYKL